MPIEYEWVVRDGENLPFKNSIFKNIVSKSFLHHVNPIKELKEIKRVMAKKGFLFLWEPGRYNPIAAIGRKFFPTTDHVKSEKPFDPCFLKDIVSQHFGYIKYEEYFHITSVAIPVLAKYCKIFKNKKLVNLFYNIDRILCHGYLKKFSWIIIIGAKKG